MEEAPPDLPERGGDKLASSLLRCGGIGTPLLSEGLGEASLPPSGELEGASLPLSLRRGGWGGEVLPSPPCHLPKHLAVEAAFSL